MEVIIYKYKGKVAICFPTPEALAKHTIQEIAVKDVPEGAPFKIVSVAELPNAPQEAWEVDDADLTDGVGGVSYEFPN